MARGAWQRCPSVSGKEDLNAAVDVRHNHVLSQKSYPFAFKVNLWAVAHPGWEAPNGTTRAAESRQTLGGFEHALAVDLAELVGSDGMVDQEGGVKQVALYGNILAVATDHAVFLVALNFQVKGQSSFTSYFLGGSSKSKNSRRGICVCYAPAKHVYIYSTVSALHEGVSA